MEMREESFSMSADEFGNGFGKGRLGSAGVIVPGDDSLGVELRESWAGVDNGIIGQGIQSDAHCRERELRGEMVDDFQERISIGDASDGLAQVREMVKAKIGRELGFGRIKRDARVAEPLFDR